jgi:hypothetical protein
MPVRHRANLTRPDEVRKCPKDLHAKLRDPKCRKEMMNARDPQPIPPKPPPSPKPPSPPIIPITPIPPFDPTKPYPVDIPNMGGGGLSWQDKLAISGAATIPAEIGVGATLISRGVAARAAAERAAAARGAEAAMGNLGGKPAQAALDEQATLLARGQTTGTEQAAGTTAARQAELQSARAAEQTTPKTTGTPIGEEGDIELVGGSAPPGLGATEVGEGVPTAGPAGGEAAGVGSFETAPLLDAGAGAEEAAAGGAASAAAEEAAGLALGPEAIPAVAAAVAFTALVSFAPEIVNSISNAIHPHSDYYYGLKHASRYGDNWDTVGDSLVNQAASISKTDPTESKDMLNWIDTLNKANSDGLEIVKWQDEATDNTYITAQKGTKSLAIAVAKYQNDPDAFKGQDPRVLAIEGLNPIMAYGKAGAVINPTTGKYQPVSSFDDIKGINATLAATSANLLKETQSNPDDDRGITADKMNEIVQNTYADADLLPTSSQNIYLSNQGNVATNVDNSVLSTQAGILSTVGTSAAALAYISSGSELPSSTPTTKSSSAPTGAATAPTTGSQSNQKPASATTTASAPTTGGTTTQKPATTTTTTQQGTATAPEAQVAQKTQNK